MVVKSKVIIIIFTILIGSIVLAQPIFAGDDSGSGNDEKTDFAKFGAPKRGEIRPDFLVPTSPAFAILGITPEEIVRPDSPKSLGLALLDTIDSNGTIQKGIAIDFAPFTLLGSQSMTLKEYRDNDAARILSNLQFSLGTTKASGDDNSRLVGIGMRVALLDKGDPRTSNYLDAAFENYIEDNIDELDRVDDERDIAKTDWDGRSDEYDKYIKDGGSAESDEGIKLRGEKDEKKLILDVKELNQKIVYTKALKDLEEARKKAKEDFEKKSWNATNFTVGGAFIFDSEEGGFKDLESSGYAAYATLAYGFDGIKDLEDTSQIILHTRYRTNEHVASPEDPDSLIEQDVFVLGTQFRIAGFEIYGDEGAPDIVFFGEYDYKIANRAGFPGDKYYKYALGIDVKASDDITITFTIGDETGNDTGDKGAIIVGDLKWAI